MTARTKSRFDTDDLLACARGEMFGPGNAQLPDPPMLMFDRITDIASAAAGPTARATCAPSWISIRPNGSSSATSSAIR